MYSKKNPVRAHGQRPWKQPGRKEGEKGKKTGSVEGAKRKKVAHGTRAVTSRGFLFKNTSNGDLKGP